MVAALATLVTLALAQTAPREIIEHVLSQVAGIQDYRATMTIQVEAPRFRMPRKEITIWYKQPNQLKIRAEGLVLLPKARLYPELLYFLRDSVEVKRVVTITEGQDKFYQLLAQPRTRHKKSFDMIFYINAQRWTVERIVLESPQIGRSEVRNVYRLQDRFWFPETTRVQFEVFKPEAWSGAPGPPELMGDLPQLADTAKSGFTGRMLIVYHDYRINSGLTDDFFQEKRRRR